MSELKPKIYMKQNQSQQEQNVNKDIQGEVKEELLESSLESLFNGIEILQVADGIAHVTIPLSVLKILNLFLKKLDLNSTLERGKER